MSGLVFFFGEWLWSVYSAFVALALRLRGVRVGRHFRCRGTPDLLIRGRASDIAIGDNVTFMGPVELRSRERGKIVIGNGCKIDRGVRLISANDATLSIGEQTNIAPYCQFNCGADVSVGKKCLIAAFSIVQSSNHGIRAGEWIKDQPHEHAPIAIGDDVWIGAHTAVLAGVTIGRGGVIGAGAVVTKDIPENAVAIGVPARVMRNREEQV